MIDLKVSPKKPDQNGRVINITPQNAGWNYVGFDLYHLSSGQTLTKDTGDCEICLILVSGLADLIGGDKKFANIGGRLTPFDDISPGALYIPNSSFFSVTALTDVVLAVCSAPGHGNHPVRLIADIDMAKETRGTGANTRYVRNILPDTKNYADSLLVVEVITPSGNWSSYPPHKHDTDALPTESFLEETYYHRLNPEQGFGFQRVYTDDLSIDEAITIENGDVVMVPKGYHPVGTPFGYDLYYLNVMAGPTRKWVFKNDPKHEWILQN